VSDVIEESGEVRCTCEKDVDIDALGYITRVLYADPDCPVHQAFFEDMSHLGEFVLPEVGGD
jgi:hypothetical protein